MYNIISIASKVGIVNTNSKGKSSKNQDFEGRNGAGIMKIAEINPYIRDAEIQNAILEGEKERYAYDHRLFYVLENEGNIIIEGESIGIRTDTVIIIPPSVGYRFCGKMKVAILNFDMTRNADDRNIAICPPVKELFSPSLIFDSTLAEKFEAPKIIHGGIFIKDGVLEIISIWNGCGALRDAETSTALKGILIDLIKHSEYKTDEREVLCSKIQGFIRLNVEKHINNSTVAKHFGYHPVYLGEIFKEKTGMSIYQAIIAERIRLAKRWLSETNIAIEDIAYEVGFSSRSHFCTSFKLHMGESPQKYRKHYAGDNLRVE